jgi:DNA-binding winged helix-turn-helix (wHTH) protein/TolB-like protein/Flp pilus assembly protein TadD
LGAPQQFLIFFSLKTLAELLQRGMSMQSQRRYEFGPFRLNAFERLLLRQGHPISLPPKAFDTLVLLIENSGRLLEKEILIQRLWPDSSVEENSLSQCIYLLRRALGEEHSTGQNQYIETVPRHGYRFIAAVREIAEDISQPGLGGREAVLLPLSKVNAKGVISGSFVDPKRSPVPFVVSAGILVVVLLAAILFRPLVALHDSSKGKISKSIAVLPFKLLNLNQQDEYLGLGLADVLITRLSENGEFNVRPIEDVQKYTGGSVDPVVAGRQLGVGVVLNGSVQHEGNKVRITMQLLNVATGTPLWGKQLDTDSSDIFQLEDTVTEEVARTFVKGMAPSSLWAPGPSTANAEAYEDYMKGRFFWSKRTAESLTRAIQFFQKAIAEDSRYAQAYAGMADSYALLGFYDFVPPTESYPKAKQAVMRALALNDGLAEAHASFLSIKTDYDWDWIGAEKEFRRAIELNPNYAPAYQWHAYVLLATGQVDAAIADLNHAMQLDPVSPGINISSAWPYYLDRRYDLCIKQCARTIELYPGFVVALQVSGMAHTQRGEYSEAIIELRKAQTLDPKNPMTPLLFAHLYAVSGKPKKAEQLLGKAFESRSNVKIPAYYVATVYAALGRKEAAFQWLDQAYADRSNWLIYLKLDPRFDSLRTDPRFRTLLSRIGLP